jgi:hypothetical protein
VSKEEIISAVKECAAKLGRAPRADEFQFTMSIQRHVIRKHFNTYADLIRECGLERRGSGAALTMEEIFRIGLRPARQVQSPSFCDPL